MSALDQWAAGVSDQYEAVHAFAAWLVSKWNQSEDGYRGFISTSETKEFIEEHCGFSFAALERERRELLEEQRALLLHRDGEKSP